MKVISGDFFKKENPGHYPLLANLSETFWLSLVLENDALFWQHFETIKYVSTFILHIINDSSFAPLESRKFTNYQTLDTFTI